MKKTKKLPSSDLGVSDDAEAELEEDLIKRDFKNIPVVIFYQNNDEGQYSLLDGIAMFICSNEEIHEKFSNEKQISNIFYKLYEKDLVNEDIFYDWYEKESNRMIQKTIETDIHEYAKGFIQWLRTAEETDDDQY
ncbi:unnamed protein product [Adineta steineri]|uniref:W2 domain-containing protein n=1 Tax=Adineta steineri TaxID=433720 RepID=A0A813YTA8_9BILA|nr:unnamed protein product [Adineta steineri]CAF3892702.1 unnamed protein product [Adineta steineri]